MTQIEIVMGDITKQRVDAITNAANSSLLGGGGVDGAIHRAAGSRLLEECRELGGCRTGEAKITKGYNLPARFIIHTVGPVYRGGKAEERDLLATCYRNCMQIASEYQLKTLAFPSISTGAYGYPIGEASSIALRTVKEIIESGATTLERVIFVTFGDTDYRAYQSAYRQVFPSSVGMLERILAGANRTAGENTLREDIAAHTAAVLASAARGNTGIVTKAEDAVRKDPSAAFMFDSSGNATLAVDDFRWHAGRFETPTIGELFDRVRQRSIGRLAHVRLWVFDGASPVTDIGSLQANNSTGTLFQVASQFNCLESPGRYVTRVVNYFNDWTQGPRASISAFPATLLRHYRAPGTGNDRFVQETDGRQVDLLADVLGHGVPQNGYFTGEGVANPMVLPELLERRFDAIRVGVHDEAQVVLGYNWDGSVENSEGRLISQVFTSTVAGGGYGGQKHLGAAFDGACRQLLRAAYLGTILAAASLGRKQVVLTLIGGGVFSNPITLILQAIQWAIGEAEQVLHDDLDVIINGHNLGGRINLDEWLLPTVRNHGGAILCFDNSGLSSIRR